MSPLSSLSNSPPSQPKPDVAHQAPDQPPDPDQARFADILRQRQAASPASGKATVEPPADDAPGATTAATRSATEMASAVEGDGMAHTALDAGTPGNVLDPAQFPPLWMPPLPAVRPAVPETLATSNLARSGAADAIANPLTARISDPTATLMETGTGIRASRGVELQADYGRSLRADLSGLRIAASQIAGVTDQPAAIAQTNAKASGEARPTSSAFDAFLASTDALGWGATPLHAEANALRNAVPLPHTVSVESRVGTPRFADETAQQVTWLAKNGIEHAEIRVKPADLGPILVRIEMQNNEALISFAVTQPETRVAVEDALHRLQEMLAESGISMGETSVGDQSFGKQLRDEHETARQRQTFVTRGEPHGNAIDGLLARTPLAARGLVDTFA